MWFEIAEQCAKSQPNLGPWHGGGCKTYGGRKTYQRTRSPENFWSPPKELLVCSVVDFCIGKTEHWHLQGVGKRTVWGGVQNPFLGGLSFVRFSTPLFFPPPHGVLWESPLNLLKSSNIKSRLQSQRCRYLFSVGMVSLKDKALKYSGCNFSDLNQKRCANWVHCGRRGSESPLYCQVSGRLWFSQARLFSSQEPAQWQHNFSTIKFALSKWYCHGVAREKQRFWTIFPSAPNPHPPQKGKFYFYCCLAVSDSSRTSAETL